MDTIYTVLIYAIEILKILILLRIIISWIAPKSRNEFIDLINVITEPILKPFRLLIPIGRSFGMDLSPLIVYIILGFIPQLLSKLFY